MVYHHYNIPGTRIDLYSTSEGQIVRTLEAIINVKKDPLFEDLLNYPKEWKTVKGRGPILLKAPSLSSIPLEQAISLVWSLDGYRHHCCHRAEVLPDVTFIVYANAYRSLRSQLQKRYKVGELYLFQNVHPPVSPDELRSGLCLLPEGVVEAMERYDWDAYPNQLKRNLPEVRQILDRCLDLGLEFGNLPAQDNAKLKVELEKNDADFELLGFF